MVGEAVQHCLFPPALRARRQPEDNATAEVAIAGIAANRRGAVQVSGLVEDQATHRSVSVGTASPKAECMQNLLGPVPTLALGQFKDQAPGGPFTGRAVKISCLVEDHGSHRKPAITTVTAGTEAVQHLVGPASILVKRQFEYRAIAGRIAAVLRRPVKVSCLVQSQGGNG